MRKIKNKNKSIFIIQLQEISKLLSIAYSCGEWTKKKALNKDSIYSYIKSKLSPLEVERIHSGYKGKTQNIILTLKKLNL